MMNASSLTVRHSPNGWSFRFVLHLFFPTMAGAKSFLPMAYGGRYCIGRGCTTTVTMSLRPLPSVHPSFVLPVGCCAIPNVFTPLQISTVLHNTWLVVMMRQNDQLKHSLRSTMHSQYASTAMSPQQGFLSRTGRDYFQETALHSGW